MKVVGAGSASIVVGAAAATAASSVAHGHDRVSGVSRGNGMDVHSRMIRRAISAQYNMIAFFIQGVTHVYMQSHNRTI